MIYLDHNATTPPHPEVLALIDRLWRDAFANPGSRHGFGRKARQVLEEARESMARILGAFPDEITFTSGGTEANNMAILGLAGGPPRTIAMTAAEHPSVLEACRYLSGRGWRLRELPVDADGLLESEAGLPWEEMGLVTVILAHNETGVIQDVCSLAGQAARHGVPLHVDGVQAVGKIPVNFHQLGVTSLSLGAHKFQGPRGAGALLLRRGACLAPVSFGGHQESDRRPGTEAVPLIAGMARALELFDAEQAERGARLARLRDRLEAGLCARCPPVLLNGSRARRLPNTLNVSFPGAPADALLIALDLAGVACSLGSTCASGATEPAPVLRAMRRPTEALHSAVRFSLGSETTEAEIDAAIAKIAGVVDDLRCRAAS
jgi:cysteine desulfurase